MKRISCMLLALCLLLCCACAAPREFTAEDVSGKAYTYEKEGFGSDFVISIYPDGRFFYYVGALSSYIGMGNWTVEEGILTLTDDAGGYHYSNRFRIGKNTLTYLAEGSTGFMYLTPEDGDRFDGREMEPADLAGHDGTIVSLDVVRELVTQRGCSDEGILALLSGLTCEELVAEWGEPTGMLSGMYGNIWDLDETHYILVYFDGNSMVEGVRISEHEQKLPE